MTDATFDDGNCDTTSCAGCTDAAACNYDASASQNDGSCDYVTCFGCMDSSACNYDATATSSDGSCTYPPAANLDCNGDCINDGNNNGICDEEETLGCTDLGACNFDTDATFSDGSCEYESCTGCTNSSACNYDSERASMMAPVSSPAASVVPTLRPVTMTTQPLQTTAACTFPTPEYDCEGNCLVDSDGDGICDAFDGNFSGCMDPLACNYAPMADEDDGSCDFCSCSGFTTDLPGYGVEIEEYATNAIAGLHHLPRLHHDAERNGQGERCYRSELQTPCMWRPRVISISTPMAECSPTESTPFSTASFPRSSLTAGSRLALMQPQYPPMARATSKACQSPKHGAPCSREDQALPNR